MNAASRYSGGLPPPFPGPPPLAALPGSRNTPGPLGRTPALFPVTCQRMGARNKVSPWYRFSPALPDGSSRIFSLSLPPGTNLDPQIAP